MKTPTTNGLTMLPNGLSALPNGLTYLPNGLVALPNGLFMLPNGLSVVYNGLSVLVNGLHYDANGLHWEANGLYVAMNGLHYEWNGFTATPSGIVVSTTPIQGSLILDPYPLFHNDLNATAASLAQGAPSHGFYPSGWSASMSASDIQARLKLVDGYFPLLFYAINPNDPHAQKTIDTTFITRALMRLAGAPTSANDWMFNTPVGNELYDYITKSALAPGQSAYDLQGNLIQGAVGLCPGVLSGNISQSCVMWVLAALSSLQNTFGVHRMVDLRANGQAPMIASVSSSAPNFTTPEAGWTVSCRLPDPVTGQMVDSFPYCQVVAHVWSNSSAYETIEAVNRPCAQQSSQPLAVTASCLALDSGHSPYAQNDNTTVCTYPSTSTTSSPSPSASPSSSPSPSGYTGSSYTGSSSTSGGSGSCTNVMTQVGSCDVYQLMDFAGQGTQYLDQCDTYAGDQADYGDGPPADSFVGTVTLTSYLNGDEAPIPAGPNAPCFEDTDCSADGTYACTQNVTPEDELPPGTIVSPGVCFQAGLLSAGQPCTRSDGVLDGRLCTSGACWSGTGSDSATYYNDMFGTNYVDGTCK